MNKIFVLFFYIVLCCTSVNALNNEIIIKIENLIITSLDIKQETTYLKILNKNLRNLNKNDVYKISKESLVKDTIKKNELLKFIDEIKLNDETLNKIINYTFKKIGFNTLDEFEEFLKISNLNIEYFKKKISTEILWNELILNKYSDKIKIDTSKIKKEIREQTKSEKKNYLLSEIMFEVSNITNLESTYTEIEKTIKKKGFENTASMYSISDSSQIGGKLGWIEGATLSNEIKNKLSKIKIGEITDPILVPGGFIILKIDDVKMSEKKIDINKELNKRINIERSKQLRQFSNIYFKKIKNNTLIYEY